MLEENKKVELNDDDLQDVTGGGKDGPSKCAAYQYRGQYTTCPNPFKGICKQCGKCELNVD